MVRDATLHGRTLSCRWPAGMCALAAALLSAPTAAEFDPVIGVTKPTSSSDTFPGNESCYGPLTSSGSVADDLPSCADVETDVIRIQVNRLEKADGVAEADFDLRGIREEFAHDEERICSSVLYFRDALLGGVGYGIYRTEDGGVAIRVAR